LFAHARRRPSACSSEIENNRQTVRLYLTPQFGANAKEFLAFEYVYTRQ
jgi:hypothetical protein